MRTSAFSDDPADRIAAGDPDDAALILVEGADRAGQADLAELLEDAVAPAQDRAVVGADPQPVDVVDEQGGDVVRLQRGGAVAIEGPELDPVEADQPGLGAEPEKAFGVLGQRPDAVGREAVAGLPALEVVLGERLQHRSGRALCEGVACPEDQKGGKAGGTPQDSTGVGSVSTRAWLRSRSGAGSGPPDHLSDRAVARHQISSRKNAAAQVGFRGCVCRMIAASIGGVPFHALSNPHGARCVPARIHPGPLGPRRKRRLEGGGRCPRSGGARRAAAAGPADRSRRGPRCQQRDRAGSLRQGAGSGVPVLGRGDAAEARGTPAYLLELVSQRWLTTAEVDKPEWRHWLTIIKPDTVAHPTALLLVGGGDSKRQAPRQDRTPGSSTSR